MNTSVPAATANPSAPLRLAKVISMGCLLVAIALPVLSLIVGFTQTSQVLKDLHLPKPVNDADLSLFQHAVLAVLGTVSSLFQAYGLLCARRCFQSFARGQFFTLEVVKGLRGFAAGVFFAIISGTLLTPLISLIATMNAPAGEHTLTAGIGSEEVVRLLFAGILWQIAAVMMRAVNLAEENSQFV